MPRQRAFAQVDVFGAGPCTGNPVAVVLDAEGLETAEMQRFANWTNLSETTFLLPATAPDGDYRARIFTPDRELPFAGHPTLGSCHAWLDAGGAIGMEVIRQECEAGLVELRRDAAGRLAFAAPPLLRSGPVEPEILAELRRALALDAAEVVDAQWVDNGPGWAAVLLESAERVLAIEARHSELDIGVVAPCGAGEDAALEVRAFFPKDGAMVEDPITGSLNASLAGWLLATGRVRAPYVARQGTALGRRGRVHVEQDADGTVWVGGATETVVSGTVAL
jgi:PhzF family phenazine biosynthesis protein